MSGPMFNQPVTIVFEGQYLIGEDGEDARDSLMKALRNEEVPLHRHMALRKDVHGWLPELLFAIDSLSPDLKAMTLDKLNLVLRRDAGLCRALIENVLKYETPVDFERVMAETTTAFNALVFPAEMPEHLRGPEFYVMWTGAVLYRCAREALPHAESVEKAERLDLAFPQVAPPAPSRRF